MPLVKHLVRTEDRCQHVLHGQRTQARLNFEHALREFRCLGGREFFAELRKNARNGVSMPLSRSDCHITAYRWYGKGRLFLLSAFRVSAAIAIAIVRSQTRSQEKPGGGDVDLSMAKAAAASNTEAA